MIIQKQKLEENKKDLHSEQDGIKDNQRVQEKITKIKNSVKAKKKEKNHYLKIY